MACGLQVSVGLPAPFIHSNTSLPVVEAGCSLSQIIPLATHRSPHLPLHIHGCSLRNWDGTKWVQVGPEALTTGTATRINFIFNSVTLGPVLCFQVCVAA